MNRPEKDSVISVPIYAHGDTSAHVGKPSYTPGQNRPSNPRSQIAAVPAMAGDLAARWVTHARGCGLS